MMGAKSCKGLCIISSLSGSISKNLKVLSKGDDLGHTKLCDGAPKPGVSCC